MLELLNDQKTNKVIKQNLPSRLRNEVCSILRDFNDLRYQNKKCHKDTFTLTEIVLNKCYGLPKTHKTDSLQTYYFDN